MNKKQADREYAAIAFFEPQNAARYANYAALHPEMAADEVVWRVNNHLDKKHYTVDALVSDVDDPCLIVNKYFRLPDDYCPATLVEVDGRVMCKVTAEAYVNMRDTAKAEGFNVSVSSAYRSISDQKVTYAKFLGLTGTVDETDKTCARPGHSEHHTGLAIDVQGRIPGGRNISKTPEAAWVKEHCYKFGFILRYQPEIVDVTGYASEPWHLRYVGVDISTDMKARDIKSLEEYRERVWKLKKR